MTDRASRVQAWQNAVIELRDFPPVAQPLYELEQTHDLDVPTIEAAAHICDQILAKIVIDQGIDQDGGLNETGRKARDLIDDMNPFRLEPVQPEYPVRLHLSQLFEVVVETDADTNSETLRRMDIVLDNVLDFLDCYDHPACVGYCYYTKEEALAVDRAAKAILEMLDREYSPQSFRQDPRWPHTVQLCKEALELINRYPYPGPTDDTKTSP